MIVFLSLFLGLVTGEQTVRLAVAERVARVEVHLDGAEVARLDGPPWQLELDLGPALTTHELLAVARDAEGRELDRVVQILNVPRPSIEAALLLDGWSATGPRTAELLWSSIRPVQPESLAWSLDGEPLAGAAAIQVQLPQVESEEIHYLRAEAVFADGMDVVAESVFGGTFGSTVESGQTAIPVWVEGAGRQGLERLEGRLVKGGEALDVVDREAEPAEVVFVRDASIVATLQALHEAVLRRIRPRREQQKMLLMPNLDREDSFRLVAARPSRIRHPGLSYGLFPASQAFMAAESLVSSSLGELRFERPSDADQRLSDAVATAGLHAATSQRRRAVVLVTEDCTADSGRWTPEQVRAYLAELRVPLVVWQTLPMANRGLENGGFCAGATSIATPRFYSDAIRRLRQLLDRQAIVWVEGRHLPKQIELRAPVDGLRLVE